MSAWKIKLSTEKLWKTSEEYGNIIQYIQMQILDDLGFSGYVMSLYTVVVIFKKRILIKSWTSKHGQQMIVDVKKDHGTYISQKT